MLELLLLGVIAVFVIAYRQNNGQNVYKFISNSVVTAYNKYAPFSFREVRQRVKDLGQEYTTRQYATQVLIIGGFAGVISYLYFFSVIWCIAYVVVAILFVPYLAYLRCKRVYSEYIFEQIQTYTTNVIMEFNTTQSFVKSLEGVRDSGIIEEPVLTDLKTMIEMAYQNGTIDESIEYFNTRYPFYMVKNMHQLFLQITKEGAKDSGESLENMSMDIDALVEGVYRDKMDRSEFHKKFLTFGCALFLLVLAMQLLLGNEAYLNMLKLWYVQLLLHVVIIVNCYFLLSGEKYYNEDVGVE